MAEKKVEEKTAKADPPDGKAKVEAAAVDAKAEAKVEDKKDDSDKKDDGVDNINIENLPDVKDLEQARLEQARLEHDEVHERAKAIAAEAPQNPVAEEGSEKEQKRKLNVRQIAKNINADLMALVRAHDRQYFDALTILKYCTRTIGTDWVNTRGKP